MASHPGETPPDLAILGLTPKTATSAEVAARVGTLRTFFSIHAKVDDDMAGFMARARLGTMTREQYEVQRKVYRDLPPWDTLVSNGEDVE